MDLVSRVKSITMNPKGEWPIIASESTSVGSLFKGYIMILAAIGPVCAAFSSLIFGHSLPFSDVVWRPSFGAVVGGLVLSYVLVLAGVWLTAFVVEKLAPTFASTGDLTQALKLVAFSQTPVWVAGALNLIPYLGALVLIAGIYGLYVAYLGFPAVMHTPQDKIVPYLVVVIVVTVVLWIVFGFVTTMVVGTGAMVGSSMG